MKQTLNKTLFLLFAVDVYFFGSVIATTALLIYTQSPASNHYIYIYIYLYVLYRA